MYGYNVSERLRSGDEGVNLDVVEVFSTLQGEGPHAGVPATFVRLAGCHLRCTFCDTDFTSKRAHIPLDTLVEQIETLGNHLVVITGGEPLRQNIVPLAASLQSSGRHVQVETAGHFWWAGLDRVADVVVSPKTAVVHPQVSLHAIAWKYIIEYQSELDYGGDGLPMSSTQPGERPFRQKLARPPKAFLFPGTKSDIYIQPCDHGPGMEIQSAEALSRAMDVCFTHGYRLSLQQHKILKMP